MNNRAPSASDSAPAEPFPVTDLQGAYLVGMSPMFELGGIRPNSYLEVDLAGIELARADRALRALIARHEQLRTVMLPDGRQRVLDPAETDAYHLPVADLVGLDPHRQQAAILRTRERLSRQGPDPTRWPLFEIVVNRIRRHRVRVHVAMSLLLLDGRSIRQVAAEWMRLYRDPGTPLPPVSTTPRDVLRSQQAFRESEAWRAKWTYWRDRLDRLPGPPRVPSVDLPEDGDRIRFTRRTHHLTPRQWQRLCVNFRSHRIMPTAALLHIFAETLGRWAAGPHFCLNVFHQGVGHAGSDPVIGQLSSTLPLEVDMCGSTDWWDRGQRLQRQLWADMSHGEVSAVRIMREVARRRGWSARAPLPYVFTSMIEPGAHTKAPRRPACRRTADALQRPQVLVDNQVHQDTPDGGIECVWETADAAFPPGLPDRMFHTYRELLETVSAPENVAPPHRPVRDTPFDGADPAHVGRICQWAAELLGVPVVGPDDDLLDLGGSLPAVRLIGRIRDMTGVDLPYRRIFAAPTPRKLAHSIDECRQVPDRGMSYVEPA
jgi:hypothetical protein